MTRLVSLGFLSNPITTLVLSEALAASTNLTVNLTTVATLPSQGVSVFTYPLAVQLTSPRRTLAGSFQFTITGPPGIYTLLASANLAAWSELGTATNSLGTALFTDAGTFLFPQKFYRARSTVR